MKILMMATCAAMLAAPAAMAANDMEEFGPGLSSGTDFTSFQRKICGTGMVCRKFNGLGCQLSKNFFSTCYLFCKKYPRFAESHCAQAAVKKHKFDFSARVFRGGAPGGGDERPVDHLARQIEKARSGGSGINAILLVMCRRVVLGKFPGKAKLFDDGSLNGLTKACNTGLGRGGNQAANQRAEEDGTGDEVSPRRPVRQARLSGATEPTIPSRAADRRRRGPNRVQQDDASDGPTPPSKRQQRRARRPAPDLEE